MKEHTRIVGKMMQTERMADGRRRLLRDLLVEIEGEPVTIPADTRTDFSSIPWFGRMLVRWSKVDIAGVVHDWYYQTGTTTRSRADAVWRIVAMAGTHRANAFQAWVGWFALRVGGGIAWHRYRNQNKPDTTSRDDFKPVPAG